MPTTDLSYTAAVRLAEVPARLTRTMPIDRRNIEEEEGEDTRTLVVSASSETPVSRWWGREVLGHGADDEIDFKPLMQAGSVLLNHDSREPVAIPVRAWLDSEARVTRVELRFPKNDAEADRAFAKVRSGLIRGVSVGYSIKELRETGENEFRATRWSIHEISLTPVPADHTVGVGRDANSDTVQVRCIPQKERAHMPPDPNTQAGTQPPAPNPQVQERDLALALVDVRAEDIKRVRELAAEAGFTTAEVAGLEADIRAEKRTVSAAYAVISEKSAAPAGPVGYASAGENLDEKSFNDALADAFLLRSGRFSVGKSRELMYNERPVRDLASDPLRLGGGDTMRVHERARELSALPVDALCRTAIQRRGGGNLLARESRESFVRIAFGQHERSSSLGMLGPASFGAALANALNKVLLASFDVAPVVFPMITQAKNLRDLRPHPLLRAGSTGNLSRVNSAGEVPKQGISDAKAEEITGHQNAGILSILESALINDDIGALAESAEDQGRAAAHTVDAELFYLILSGAATGVLGPIMNEDGISLWSTAGHANMGANANTPPSETLYSTVREAMRKQVSTSPSRRPLNISPDLVLVGAKNETAANKMFANEIVPGGAQGDNNEFRGKILPVVTAYIDNGVSVIRNSGQTVLTAAGLPTLCAFFSRSMPALAVGFLGGVMAPRIVVANPIEVLGSERRVDLTFGVAAQEWRSTYAEKGVTD